MRRQPQSKRGVRAHCSSTARLRWQPLTAGWQPTCGRTYSHTAHAPHPTLRRKTTGLCQDSCTKYPTVIIACGRDGERPHVWALAFPYFIYIELRNMQPQNPCIQSIFVSTGLSNMCDEFQHRQRCITMRPVGVTPSILAVSAAQISSCTELQEGQ